jgi:hypothetical protein
MGKADESIYTVNSTDTSLGMTPDSSIMLPPSSTHDNSPLLEASSNVTVKRKRRHKPTHRIVENIEHDSHSKRFNSCSTNHTHDNDDRVAGE